MNELFSSISTKCYELANTIYTSIGSPNPSPYIRGIWNNFLSTMTTLSSYFSWSERTVNHENNPETPKTQTVNAVVKNTINPSQEKKKSEEDSSTPGAKGRSPSPSESSENCCKRPQGNSSSDSAGGESFPDEVTDDSSKLHPIERDIAKEYERMLSDLPNKSRRLLSELLMIAEARQEELNSHLLTQLIQSLKLLLDPNTALDNQIVDERRIRSDGNCLFNAVLGGLHDHGLEIDSNHMTLRLMAITHLREQLRVNPDDTRSFLAGAIMVYQEAKREGLALERIFLENHSLECETGEKEQIEAALRRNEAESLALEEFSAEQYLELAAIEGFFCGETELRALSETLGNVTIHVHNRATPRITSYGEGDKEIHILYNGRDHYDRYLVAKKIERS